MTTMITEVYDALVSAGADDGKFASLERRIDVLERRIDVLESSMNGRFATVGAKFSTLEVKIDGKFNVLAWMFGILVAGVSAIVIRLFA